MEQQVYDLAIIGGGINGCGIASDASGRGLNVFLCEQGDLASGTSSVSSKLIHGGLRYLEHYEFRLVKEALAEREILLSKAPHLIKPLKFTLPHRPHLRPAWMIRSGLFLYDHLSKRNSLPSARFVKLDNQTVFQEEIKKGFEYYDCWADDARLVVVNAKEAKRLGADILTRTRCTGIEFDSHAAIWNVHYVNTLTGERSSIKANHIVNAAGPWLNKFLLSSVPQVSPARNIRLIKGSHIIVPRVPGGDSAYILQNADKRIVFVLPYQKSLSIIGTTDKEYNGELSQLKIDQDEIDYLLDVYNQHFQHKLTEQNIIDTYTGVRPLCDDESGDPSAITRDYTISTQSLNGSRAFISIYGGKITTYRKLAAAVMSELKDYVPGLKPVWNKSTPLPGCLRLGESLTDIENTLLAHYKNIDTKLLKRYASTYGHDCASFLKDGIAMTDLGRHFGHGLYEAEVRYLVQQEWALTADDILKRRTKLGHEFNDKERQALDEFLKEAFQIPEHDREELPASA
jgi:glycerol-3-phosphate dehydrogenase